MPIQVKCRCGRTVNFRDEQAGSTVACLYCGAKVPVPGTPPPPPPGIRCPRCRRTAPAGSTRCPACERMLDGSPAMTPAGAMEEARGMYEATPREIDARLAGRLEAAVLHCRARAPGQNAIEQKAMAQAEMEKSLRESPLVAAYAFMANTALFEPGSQPYRAGIVFALEPRLRFDEAYLAKVADILAANAKAHPRDPARSAVREPFVDESWTGCVPIPTDLGVAPGTYLADMWIEPRFLPGFCLQGALVPGIANPHLKQFRGAWVVHV